MAGCSLNRSPKKNWVENSGGLPDYICRIARAIERDHGLPLNRAIPIAISRAKTWSTGTHSVGRKGVKRVTPKTQARAGKATAEWYALRAKSKIKSRVAKTSLVDPAILEGVSDSDFNLDLTEFRFDVPIAKIDVDKQLAFGWASVAKRKDGTIIRDHQGDELQDLDAMEDVAYKFVTDCRDGGEMHVRKGVAQLVESFMVTPEKLEKMGLPSGSLPIGWWVGYKVLDEDVWKGVKDGKYRQFSVHGKGRRQILEEDSA